VSQSKDNKKAIDESNDPAMKKDSRYRSSSIKAAKSPVRVTDETGDAVDTSGCPIERDQKVYVVW
jgi:hypothetical protein